MNQTELEGLTKGLGDYGRQFNAWVQKGFNGTMPKATKDELSTILAAERRSNDRFAMQQEDTVNWTVRHDSTPGRPEPASSGGGKTPDQMKKAGYEWKNGPD